MLASAHGRRGERERKLKKFEYLTLRNLTPKGLDSKIYRGVCEASALVGIPTDKNVRDAIEKSTKLRTAMRASIAENPQDFVLKNGGVTMLVKSIKIDDAKRFAELKEPSIINGAQTQAVAEWWAEREYEGEVPLVQFEILVLDTTELEREVSVTRNSMNKVNVTSIMGYQGHFDDLVKDVNDTFSLRETDKGKDPVKLLQVAELLDSSWEKPWSTYSSKASVLSRYAKADANRKSFLHGIAPLAWKLYQEFRHHDAFRRCGLQQRAGGVTRDKKGKFLHASDALVFPILYAHRERLDREKLTINRLTPAQERRLVENAVTHFTANAKSDVSTMGRKRAAYDDLRGRLEWLQA